MENSTLEIYSESFELDTLVPANRSESRNVVISEYRHAALVEDTVETISEESSASNKHRKVATLRTPRRRAVLRPTLSNSGLATSTRAIG